MEDGADGAVITDVQGRELCHLRSRMMSLRKTFVAEDPQGKELLVVTKKLSCKSPPREVYLPL
jgi:uncharacterized protein YxjI